MSDPDYNYIRVRADTVIDPLIRRLMAPPFGTETSERNLMREAAAALRRVTEERDAYKDAHEKEQILVAQCVNGWKDDLEAGRAETAAAVAAALMQAANHIRKEADDLADESNQAGVEYLNEPADEILTLIPAPAMAALEAVKADARKLKPDAETLARMFHDAYESFAPLYGYTTRDDTKEFDRASPNGRLMIAVCARILAALDKP